MQETSFRARSYRNTPTSTSTSVKKNSGDRAGDRSFGPNLIFYRLREQQAIVKRRTILLFALVILGLCLCVSLLTDFGRDFQSLTVQKHWKIDSEQQQWQPPLAGRAPSKYASAPGFENALPSCRISDLTDDPLVKEYGENNIRLSRTYEGSGSRIRKVLRKAQRGEAIKVAVIGGSVSTVSNPSKLPHFATLSYNTYNNHV